MKLRKMLAAFIAAAAAVSVMTVSASAVKVNIAGTETSIDTKNAVELVSGDSYSGDSGKKAVTWYTFTANKSGTLKLKYETSGDNTNLLLFDSKGNVLERSDENVKSGKLETRSKDSICAHAKGGTFSATFSYKIDEGTYYIAVAPGWQKVKYGGKFKLNATFPSEPKAEKKSGKTATGDMYLSAEIEKGGSLKLEAEPVSSGKSVKYSTSDKSVATVGKDGTITGKKAGSAVITIKCGKTQINLNVTVK